MTLTPSPPRYAGWADMLAPIKLGARGWRAFAVQEVVGAFPDGVWGPDTDRAVKSWQRRHGLAVDGVFGPASQGLALRKAGSDADHKHNLPEGVGYGFAVGEGAGVLAATNWSVPGGVDCGPAQWRVYGPPFDMAALKRAFDAATALDHACARLAAARSDFVRRNRHLRARPMVALRVAVLQHNWPFAADQIVRRFNGTVKWWRCIPSPDAPATWTTKPGGGHYSRAAWCRHYPTTILRFA